MAIWIDKNSEGAWRLSKLVRDNYGEYLMTRTYYFYNKQEAIRLFKKEIAAIKQWLTMLAYRYTVGLRSILLVIAGEGESERYLLIREKERERWVRE